MTSLESLRWLEKQAGVTVYIGHEGRVTIFLEGHVQVHGNGIHEAVQNTIKVYEQMVKSREKSKGENCLRN